MKEMTNEQVEKEFTNEMYRLYTDAKALRYNANWFKIMLDQNGARKTAQMLIASDTVQTGFERLWEMERLDLTVENRVLKDPFNRLFTAEELRQAKQRLLDYGYRQ
jgi:hypothetical protein